MDSQQGKASGSGCFMGSVMTASILSTGAAASLIVLITQQGNSGMFGEPSIQVQSCPTQYFTQKFANIGIINRIVFVFSILAALIGMQIGIVAMGWFCQKCNTSKQPEIPREKLFFLCGSLAMVSVPPLGYYFTFYVELNNCIQTVNFSHIITTLAAAGILMSITAILSILILCKTSQKTSRAQKYRVMETYQTQAVLEVKTSKPDWRADLRSNNIIHQPLKSPPVEDLYRPNQITQQAILTQDDQKYYSPKKTVPEYRQKCRLSNNQAVEYDYPITKDGPIYRPDPIKQRSPQRNPPVHMQERITSNLHPKFAYKNEEINQPQVKQDRPQNDGESQFFREQQKYLQSMNQNQNLLPRGGLQQRDVYQYHNHPQHPVQERPQIHPNYAKIYHPQDDRGQYYSPTRPRHQNSHQNDRRYISTREPDYYTQPQQYQDRNDQNRVHRRSPNFNHMHPNHNNNREEDYQQQSFRFYEDSRPRNPHYYR